MNNLITFPHGLSSFQVTKEPESVQSVSGNKKMVITRGSLCISEDRRCPHCAGFMYVHQHHEITLQHLPLHTKTHILKIDRVRFKCICCGHVVPQEVPFKVEGHRITYPLQKSIISLLEKGFTLKDVSELLDVNPSLVKDIDKKRLESKFKDKSPERYSRHIGIDEFLLHKHHRYATVVMDLDTGHVLFCEEGKKKEQVYHFINQMGPDWMSHLVAVAMDMNAHYASAFREKAPHLEIVYDTL